MIPSIRHSAAVNNRRGTVTVPITVPVLPVSSTVPLSISAPSHYQVFQRNRATNQGSIVVSGTSFVTSPVEVRYKGGAWTAIGTASAGQTFSFIFPNQPVGQGSLEIRLQSNPSFVVKRDFVAVGVLILAIGQSNMAGLGDNRQTPYVTSGGSTLRASLSFKSGWIECLDPYARNAGTDSVRWNGNDITSPHGGYMALLAGYFLAQGIPVGIIPSAKSGTLSASWVAPTNLTDNTTLFGAALSRALEASHNVGCEIICWHQGESDAQTAVSTSTYAARLQTIGETFATHLKGTFFACKLQNNTESTAAAGQAAINQGITNAIAASPKIEPGPDLSVLTTASDGLHLKDNISLLKASALWWNALAAFYGYTPVTVPSSYPSDPTPPTYTGTVVTLTSPVACQVFQRDPVTNTGTLVVSGSINATDNIEWRWQGGTWATLATAVAGGFYFEIPSQPVGQGLFEVRPAGTPGNVTSVATVGIGAILLCMGGATMAGRSTNAQWYKYTAGSSDYKAVIYDNAGFRELFDAVNVNTNTDDIAKDGNAAGGYIPLLAGRFLDQGIPVCVVMSAIGGARIANFLPDAQLDNRNTLFGSSLVRSLNASKNRGVEAAIIHIGRGDTQDATTTANYRSRLTTVATTIEQQLGCKTFAVKLEHSTNTFFSNGEAAVWAGHDEAIANSTSLRSGGDLSNLNTEDTDGTFPGQLLINDSTLLTVSDRIFRALDSYFNYTTTKVIPSTPDTSAPTSSLIASNITTQVATYQFQVSYNDIRGSGIKVSTVVNNNAAIIVTGPSGYSQAAQYVSINLNANGAPRTVTYQIPQPAGGWEHGTYAVNLQANQVSDTLNNFMPAAVVGNIQSVFFSSSIVMSQFMSNVTSNSGTVSTAQQQALSDWVAASIASGTWNYYYLVIPVVGDINAAQCYLKYPTGITKATNVNFVAGDVTDAGGLVGTPIGQTGTKYFNLNINLFSLAVDSTKLGIWYYTKTPGTAGTSEGWIGAQVGSQSVYEAIGRFSGGSFIGGGIRAGNFNQFAQKTPVTDVGLFGVNNENTVVSKLYWNGAFVSTPTSTPSQSTVINTNLYLQALRLTAGAGVTTFSRSNCLFAALTVGMPSSLVATMNTEVQALITALGR